MLKQKRIKQFLIKRQILQHSSSSTQLFNIKKPYTYQQSKRMSQNKKDKEKNQYDQQNKQTNRTKSQSFSNIQILQNIISSNQQLIKSQSFQIKAIHLQLMKTQEQLKLQVQKYRQLQQKFNLIANRQQLQLKLNFMTQRIKQLQQQLIQTKVDLAVKSSDSLEKDATIRDLNIKYKLLDEEIQKMSSISQTSQQRKQSPIKNTFKQPQVNKQNIQNFIQDNIGNDTSIFTSLRSIIDKQIFGKNNSSQIDTVLKAWQKQVNQHILPKQKRFSFLSTVKRQVHLQKFTKQTHPLLKKYYGMPHIHRSKVWAFITDDKLGISNSFYIQLLQRRNKGWVSQKIKIQIEKDILRSFNGQGSKQKLQKIYQIGLNKAKSQIQPSFTRRNSISTIQQTNINQDQQKFNQNQQAKLSFVQSPERLQTSTPKLQQKTQNHFRIAQDVTQVLQLFYIYRPDIGFVQGMTYPTIVLTLVTGKLNSFRILCNLLLCNDFFKKMITFQPNFINYFCRIFDELLLSYNLTLYNRLFKQFQIKSQVFLVDWFFTFFSRGISPMTILRIWDLMLYHLYLNPKAPQLVMYRLSLIILQLLQPILLQVNYEESIRTIREYSKKLDEEELIKKLYQSMKDSSLIKTFQEKYLKVKLRVQKIYDVKDDSI